MQFQELVEAHGHLIDSHIMEEIFDKVVENNGRFEVEEFSIGRTNGDRFLLRLKVESPTADDMDRLLGQLLAIGCSPGRFRRRATSNHRSRSVRAGRFLLHHEPQNASSFRK